MRTEVRTACPLDCPDACSVVATIEDGKLIAVDAAPAGDGNPLTQGFICQKVKHHARRVYAPDRVLTPLIRSGAKGTGEFRQASWDEALELVAAKIKAAVGAEGPDSVLAYLYNSSAGALGHDGLTGLLFDQLAVPKIAPTICAATTGAAWQQTFGSMLSGDPLDIVDAKLIVVWGANPTVSNTHLLPLITEARKRGAALVVIDPRRTGVAARADLHLAIMPGTDVLLAYAAAKRLEQLDALAKAFINDHVEGADQFMTAARSFDIAESLDTCGISAADFDRFVELIRTLRPATMRIGWGIERNRNGGSGIIAAFGLWGLLGHFGSVGSGVLGSTSSGAPVDTSRLRGPGAPIFRERTTLSMNDVGAVLCGELPSWKASARVLVVQGANPAVTAVDQARMLRGLASESTFTVVHDQVLTDTALFADVVLPATTHFESADVAGSYGSFTVQPLVKVIDAVGLSRSNDQFAVGLAAHLGIELATSEHVDEGPVGIVTDGGGVGPRVTRERGRTVQFVDTFPHDGTRMRLYDASSELPVPQFRPAPTAFPLVLLSPATNKTINSMFAEFDPPAAVVSLNPADAESRGLTDGEEVLVSNALGSAVWPLRVDSTLRAGVCHIPKGLWRRHTAHGWTSNQFVGNTITDLAAGACFNDARVEIRSAHEGAAL